MNLYVYGILVLELVQKIVFAQWEEDHIDYVIVNPNELSSGLRSTSRPKKLKVTSCVATKDSKDGVYKINAGIIGTISVYCIQDKKKPWTVALRRTDGSTDFDRPLVDYSRGFGDPNGEYWIGLEALHALTNSKQHELWIRVGNGSSTLSSRYDRFAIGNADEDYMLYTLGLQKFTLPYDNFQTHMGNKFSVKDKDFSKNNCPRDLNAGWWFYEEPQISYHDCADSYLTGKYNGHELPDFTFHHFEVNGNKVTEAMMAIRPI